MDSPAASTHVNSYSFSRRQVIWTLAGVMLAMLLSALDQTVVGTAMPRIIADLGGFNQYTWVTSIYMITSAVSISIVGKLSDIYGRKVFYLIGISVFVAFSISCGLSRNMTELIIFRGLQGVGGGIMMTNAFTVIADIFPPEERGKYQGLLTSVWSFASVVGPSTGGFLTDNVSWHWVFFINAPVGAVAILVFLKFFPKFKSDNLKHTIDYAGLTALVLTVGPTMLALSWGGVDYAWKSPQIIGLFSFAALSLVAFLFLENRAKEPIIPFSLFKYRIVVISNLASFLTGMGMFGSIVFIPLFLQGVLGASATLSGNMQIPQSIAVMIMSIVVGRMISRPKVLYRTLGTIAMGLICLGLFMLSRLDPSSHYWEVIIFIVVVGFGMGMTMPIFTISIQNTVPYSQLGVATSSSTFIRAFGGAVGLSVLGSIMNNHFLTGFIGKIPESLKASIPMNELTALAHNPQALVSPQAQAKLQELLTQPGAGTAVYEQTMHFLHQALSNAISVTFLTGAAIISIGFIAAFFLKNNEPQRKDR